MGTHTNVLDLMNILEAAKAKCQADRNAGIKSQNRQVRTLLFVDLEKAFDKVVRSKLMEKLHNVRIPPYLLNAIHALLRNTCMQIKDDVIQTDSGVPQGSVISPTLFAIYIDDLLRQIQNEGLQVLAYADDLVVYADSVRELNRATEILDEWSGLNGIRINRKKSAILELRVDQRTQSQLETMFKGYPVQKTYKYLGTLIDNDATLRMETTAFKKKEKETKRLLDMNWAKKLP